MNAEGQDCWRRLWKIVNELIAYTKFHLFDFLSMLGAVSLDISRRIVVGTLILSILFLEHDLAGESKGRTESEYA